MSVNKAILVGFVGNDPEVRYLDSGTPVCNFRMATSETYKNKAGERVTTTEWHNIVLWRGLAEVAEKYVKKGTQIYDRDGNKRYTTEIVGDTMQLLGKKSDDSSGDSNAPSGQEENMNNAPDIPEADATDDLPF